MPDFAKKMKKAIRNPAHLMRRGVQLWCVCVVALAAWQFSGFVEALRNGGVEAFRPPVVEGFLPVAAIVALRSWVATGVIDPIHPAGLVLLAAALVTAFIFRRALCSWVCPLGALSEFLWKVGAKLPWRVKRLHRWLDWPLLGLKYAVFVFVVKYFFFMDAGQAVSFMRTPYYAVSDVKMFDFFGNIGPLGIAVMAGLAVATLLVRSFWCRYLCPYGAVLGVLGLLSPFQLKKDGERCNGCGICNEVCPGVVAVAQRERWVVSAECTGCTGCVAACPKRGALTLRFFGMLKVRPVVFGALFVAVFFGAIVWAKYTDHWQGQLPYEQYRRFDAIMSRGVSDAKR